MTHEPRPGEGTFFDSLPGFEGLPHEDGDTGGLTIEDLLAALAAQDAADKAAEDNANPNVNSQFSESNTTVGRFRVDTKRNITESIRRYVDVPTAKEFLNDFETGVNTYLADQRETGNLSQFDLDLARDAMGSLLDDYLGELGQRAARGEDIFEVVGVSSEIQRLGERPGQSSQQTTTTKEKSSGSQSTSSASKSSSTSDGAASGSQASQGTTTSKTDTTTDSRDETNVEQTEQIFRRENLTSVFKLSPAQFLEGRFANSGDLATVLRSRAGRGRAIEVRGGAGVVSGARRA